MMKRLISLVLLCFILGGKIHAWGKQGHEIVAQIAKTYMEKNVIDSVEKYLGIMNFEEAAVWMDAIKKESKYDIMKPWHYVNIEKDKTYVETKKPDIINKLTEAIKYLHSGDRNSEKVNFSIKVIFHLVGDIHQPLHVGYGEDRGGNEIEVKYALESTNLHKIWDDEIINAGNITKRECLKLASEYKDGKLIRTQIIDVPYWSHESRSLLNTVYDFKGDKIDREYMKNNVPVVKEQLLKAGIRLATIMNKAFKK